MPEWCFHKVTGEWCSIPRSLMDRINRFVDNPSKPEYHDSNRLIVSGHWLPMPLLCLALVVYEYHGRIGVKALLHHHLLDYANTLLTRGKWRSILKMLGPDQALIGVSNLVTSVLNNIVKDFTRLKDLDLIPLLKELIGYEFSWLIFTENEIYFIKKELDNLVDKDRSRIIVPEEQIRKYHELIDKAKLVKEVSNLLVKCAEELKPCIKEAVRELTLLKSGFFKDICVICKCSLVGEEVEKIGFYKAHRNCIKTLLKKPRNEIEESLKHLPPSVAKEILKRLNV